jgi:lipopolysaccharide biosynthesis protein
MADATVKLIAFYLPQFHPIRENDLWWGRGFTDWINVVRARPSFAGHYQPHLPADLGFYDLRLEETRIAQAHLARDYGIYGFCYYHYWFNGKRLLERPFQEVLFSGRPDFPFCLCWANENWTRRWDGREEDILMEQRCSLEDARDFIAALFRAFDDPRYIRVHGRPLLLVYRVDIIPQMRVIASLWRQECRKAGVGDPYLCMVESFGNMGRDPGSIGFDAAVEFPPHNQGWPYQGILSMLSQGFFGEIFDWREARRHLTERQLPSHTLFRTVMPMWDNTPRNQERAHIYHGSSPQTYGEWLHDAVRQTRRLRSEEERLIFINAWNEWGEGCHLEPDLVHGHAYLRATRDALAQEGEEAP